MIPDGVSALLDEHRSSLLSLAQQVRMDDEVASALDSATPEGMSERGWADSGQPGPLEWPGETVVTLKRVEVHIEVINALAQRFEQRLYSPGLADKIAGDLAGAAAAMASALGVHRHGGPLIVPDFGPDLSVILMAHERAISELETVSHVK
jgi:hypothetical protein